MTWEKVGRADWDIMAQVQAAHDKTYPRGPLWTNGPSSSNGLLDKVPEQDLIEFTSSLTLIQVNDLTLDSHYEWGKHALRARFSHLGIEYWLKVTDPVYECKYGANALGTYKIGSAFLTISLAEPFDGGT